MKPAIAVMAKAPLVGRVKTRLCPPLSPDLAAELYAACLDAAVAAASAVAGADVLLAVAVEDRPWMVRAFPALPTLVAEGPAIGDCLEQTFSTLLAAGRTAVVAIASDTPALDAPRIAAALAALADHDAALVAALDGGYSLLGLRRPAPFLFDGIPWSTPEVLRRTLSRLAERGCSWSLVGEALRDVDRVADLEALRAWLDVDDEPRLARLRAVLARWPSPSETAMIDA